MATTDDLKTAIGCLSTVFPQFVAKELAVLTDQIASAIQGFTDPLAAIGDLQVDQLVSDVDALSQQDTFGALAGVAVGLGGQYVKRELTDYVDAMASEFPSVTKRVQQIRNIAGQVSNSVGMMMSMFPDMPYAAAQRMCRIMIDVADLKSQNLQCLRKHIVQLVNAVMIVAKQGAAFKDGTLTDLAVTETYLKAAQAALTQSQRIKDGATVFDTKAFERARQALLEAGALLTPDKDGTTIMDLVDIASFGSVAAADVKKQDRMLANLVIPSLCHLIEAEVAAVVSQTQVLNFYVQQLGQLISNYRKVGQASKIQVQRSRAIREMQSKLTDLIARIDLAIARGSIAAASGEMLLWSSRVKAILATMDQVKDLTLQEGSVEGPDKAAALEAEFQLLLANLTAISNDTTSAGIENPLTLRDQVLSLTKGARRLLKEVEAGRTNENYLATFHALALATATRQASRTEQSITVASLQKVACERFSAIDLAFGPRYESMLDSMRQLGFDRGVDMLSSGGFAEFLEADTDLLSYVGTAIVCLKHGIDGTDDAQTRQQLSRMREDLIAKRSNSEIAAADSADQGRSRFITKVKSQISTIQKNAKTVESIVADLKQKLAAAGESLDQSLEGIAQFNALLGNVDQLAVVAGGRLAAGLEEFSEHPNAGVVACD